MKNDVVFSGEPGDLVSLLPLTPEVHNVRTQGLLYPLAIRKNVAIGEAHADGRSVLSYAPRSHGAADYTELVDLLVGQEG